MGGQRPGRMVVALLGAAAVLIAAWWFDTDVMQAVLQAEDSTFDVTQTAVALPVGYLMIAAGVLVVALLGRWADSRLVALIYALTGAFFAFLFTLVWALASGKNEAAPILPQPLAAFLGNVWTSTESGQLHAVPVLGAAMFLVGAASLTVSLRRRPNTGD
jgi:hypothetical protein